MKPFTHLIYFFLITLLLVLCRTSNLNESANIPSAVSYENLCCLDAVLRNRSIPLIHETNYIKPLPESTVRRWEGKEFPVLKNTDPFIFNGIMVQKAENWYRRTITEDSVFFEFQRLDLNKKSFLLAVHSTSPVTRTTVVFQLDGRFLFSTHGDLLAVEPLNQKMRLYFWNPTGSDFSIVDFFAETDEFVPVIAVFDSGGTFDGSFMPEDRPVVPLVRTGTTLSEPVKVYDHFSKFQKLKDPTELSKGTRVLRLAEYEKHTLIGYAYQKPFGRYQPSTFFENHLYTTAWVKNQSITK